MSLRQANGRTKEEKQHGRDAGAARSKLESVKSTKSTRKGEIFWLPIAAFLSAAMSIIYLSLRTCNLWRQEGVSYVMWLALGVESAVAVPRLLTQLAVCMLASGPRQDAVKAPERRPDVKLPRVDVFICYCGEGLDILIDTVRAACGQDYPSKNFRVVVLDDSASPGTRKTIEELCSSLYPHLRYATRNIKPKTHCKAGNLNFGLFFTDSLTDGGAELVAELDVDMIPETYWLRTVVSHVEADPTIGMACPWQYFYNTPPGDPVAWGADIAYWVLLIQFQNLRGQAPCSGTGFAIRRKALDQLGGFPEDCVSEDILTSALLGGAGWKTAFVPGCLQWGLAASSMADFLRMRARWMAGFLSITSYLTSPPQGHGLDMRFRFGPVYWGMGVIDITSAITWTFAIFVFPALLLTGEPLLANDQAISVISSRSLLQLAIFDFAAHSAFQGLISSLLDWEIPLFCGPLAGAWNAPYRSSLLMRIVMAKLLGHQSPRFTPTGISSELSQNERNAREKSRTCLWSMLWDCGAWMHVSILIASTMGGLKPLFDIATNRDATANYGEVLGVLRTTVLWPPLFFLWIVIVRNAWRPLSYGIWPPPSPDREALLERDSYKQAARPKRALEMRGAAPASQRFWKLAGLAQIVLWLVFDSPIT